MSEFQMVQCTLPNDTFACALAQEAVERRIAACAQVVPHIESFFYWEDTLQICKEALVLFKITADLYPELEKLIIQNHPYEEPEIVVFDIVKGHTNYLNWIKTSTHEMYEQESSND